MTKSNALTGHNHCSHIVLYLESLVHSDADWNDRELFNLIGRTLEYLVASH